MRKKIGDYFAKISHVLEFLAYTVLLKMFISVAIDSVVQLNLFIFQPSLFNSAETYKEVDI